MGKRPGPSAFLAIPIDHQSSVPLFRQLYDGLRAVILAGTLPAGTRLPSSRTLADELNVSRNTVMTAFEQMLVEGYLDGKAGSGTYVAEKLPDKLLAAERVTMPKSGARPPERRLSRQGTHFSSARLEAGLSHSGPIPFCPAVPAVDAFPFEVWGRLLSRRWRRDASDLLGYGALAGYRPLREAISTYLASARSVRCTPDQVIIVAGAQQGLDLAARVLLDPGDMACIEDPGYLGARAALQGAGAVAVPVAVDAEGLDVAAGFEACPQARVIFVCPSHQYPLGVTMSLARRLALLDWARRCGAWVIEDDYDSEYRYTSRPLASLQGLDAEGQVIYVGTFSKVLFPALRLGYMVVPEDLVDTFVHARAISDRHAPTLEQAVLADFIEEGYFTSHIRRMRELYAQRQAGLVELLRREMADQLQVEPADGGMHLVGWLSPHIPEKMACQQAEALGVEAIGLSAYAMRPQPRGGLVLGFAGLDEAAMSLGVHLLKEALQRAELAAARDC